MTTLTDCITELKRIHLQFIDEYTRSSSERLDLILDWLNILEGAALEVEYSGTKLQMKILKNLYEQFMTDSYKLIFNNGPINLIFTDSLKKIVKANYDIALKGLEE